MFPFLEDLTILNSILTIRFHSHKLLIFSNNLLLDVFMASCSMYNFQCITAPGCLYICLS